MPADAREAFVLALGIEPGDGVAGPARIMADFSVLLQDASAFSAILGDFWNDCSDCLFIREFTCQICFFHHEILLLYFYFCSAPARLYLIIELMYE